MILSESETHFLGSRLPDSKKSVSIGVNPWQKKSQPSIATTIATVPFP
jgi:hypothetical protein